VSGVRRAAAAAAIALGCLASAVPSYAAHDAHHGRPKPWPACPHGHERASYPPRSCHLQTDRSAVQPGGRFDAIGQGFRPGEGVVVSMPADGGPLATVPASVPPGTHTLNKTAPSGNPVERMNVVTAKHTAATRAHHDSLPFSGPAAAIPLAAAGVMMLASGAVVMAMVRRRRRFLVDG
jgi:hypothetical protein